jgi:uncharacterized protein YndB with AHSA1/START domain
MSETQTITVEYDLPQAPEKVWRALTDSELIAAWLMPNDFRPTVGHKFNFRAKPMHGWDGVVHCEVLEVDAPKRLRYSWRGGAGPFQIDTEVAWTLSPSKAGGTLLKMEHSGFHAKDAPAFGAMGEGWRGNIAERLRETVKSL